MRTKDIALALLVPTFWGFGFTMAKPAIEHFPPLFTMLIAYSVTGLLILSFWRERRRTRHWHLAVITSCVVTLQGALVFFAYKELPASVTTLVVQVQVPFAVLAGRLVLGEELSLRKIIGIAIALLGVGVVVGLPDERPPLVPVLLVMAGAVVWAAGQVLARKLAKDDGMVMLRSISLHAVPQLLIATLLFETGQWQSLLTATPFQWVAFCIFAFVGFFCAYSLWYTLLSRTRVDELMPFVLLMPIIGVLAAAVILKEPVTLANLAGGAMILAGVAVVTGVGFRSRLQSAAAQPPGG